MTPGTMPEIPTAYSQTSIFTNMLRNTFILFVTHFQNIFLYQKWVSIIFEHNLTHKTRIRIVKILRYCSNRRNIQFVQ